MQVDYTMAAPEARVTATMLLEHGSVLALETDRPHWVSL
jgi:hypothetical protein